MPRQSEGGAADSGGAAPAGGHPELPPPVEPQTSVLGASTPEPPKPAKDEELDAIKKAVDDAASVGGGLWLSYLFVLFYLAVATGAVTHADLFLENPVKLPFLNIELPLLTFFFLAPILFLIVHAYTLVHLVMLTEKAKRFHQALHDSRRKMDAAARERLQWQLPSNIFIQFLVGPPGIRGGPFGAALRAIAWITLVIAPVLLLLTMQIQFLPFHSAFITRTHRVALVVDLLLLGWLWRKVLSGRELGGPFRASWVWPILGSAIGLTVILFSWTVATFPGEPQQEFVTRCSSCRLAGTFRERIFESPVDPTNRRRQLPFSNTLVLTGFNILEGIGIDDPDKAKWRDYIFRARGRDLKGARFDFASLPRVDFTGANLDDASFENAQLDRASLDGAQLRAASLNSAQLKGASFDCEDLEYRKRSCAQLQGASLDNAQLQGASLEGAKLQGASLFFTQLQGTHLASAKLQGALLFVALLQGADLDQANLQGASLDGSRFEGASLSNARLEGASFHQASLQGASLNSSIMEATDLSSAYFWRANGPTPPSTVAALWMQGDETWLSHWDDKDYQNLRTKIEALPPGEHRENALDSIKSLDCSNSDRKLEPCDAGVPPSPEAAAWRKMLEAARVDEPVYIASLAKILKGLVCSGGGDAIYILRGVGFRARLDALGAAASGLIDDLTNINSKDCAVSASLTDADRAGLIYIKERAMKAGK